ncbi:MAG: cysteine--tRNA ligase [Clostridiales bacterium]|jgi:cysteinyl-tRNA synthetase|nr:cysteine--tRNA ligase [Clostridiales bacterium]MCI1961822.1 cysteine--tRNA ligase [Clostridiales bacterium]MCI2022445.1 cysteine--tRNA ligase [Clostridiales bacterium]MCI2026842.1 cysteine--tRNA ligase [Clostridiales bacterium]
MRIYNTLTRQKEEFVPITPGEAKIYACGPTVYNYIHIGNARPICVFDVLRRYLEYRGMKVTFVQNFTDVDDKIIRKANEENSDYLTVSRRYIEEYKKDAEGMNVRPATIHPKATENIKEIQSIISTLIQKGYAYPTENGDVYFRTLKDSQYGKLSHQPLEDLQAGARIATGEIKEDAMDFALWKGAKQGEPYWESPWGHGRPGWHIECSAMARRYLGKTIDIHCGGQDLIFPHHENEIAQSECCNGVPFAHYWMHNGYINVDNRKMSKSWGNFFTVREVAQKFGYEPIRYLMVSSHYRTPINYSIDVIDQCKASLERLYNCRENLEFVMKNAAAEEKPEEAQEKKKLDSYRTDFIEAMDDDLNTANALSAIFDLARIINTDLSAASNPSGKLCEYALSLFNELCDVLGLLYQKKETSGEDDQEIEALVQKRTEARKNKDWKTADEIRDTLKARGIVLEDTPQGIKWKRA